MAEKISIDIPGIGQVEANGFSSEETLQRIAAALENSNKGLAKEQKNQANALKDTTKATKDFATGWVAAGDNVIQSFKNLALTATSVATKFFANYDQIAKNPIKAGTQILNTAIDVTTDFVGGLVSAVPVIGGFLKGLVDATGALYKLANEALANQLEKNVEALKEYAKTGIGFTQGMQDMQRVAQLAGMGITEFSEGVTKAKANLNLLGMSGGDAAERLAKNLGQLNKKGPGGLPSLREEIYKMGFSLNEQIDIAAQYMGQQQALGRLEKMSKEELAQGTRDYARDLKVVADYTGKEAKEVKDKSRKASQLAILQAVLNKEQLESFRGVYESLDKLGPNADKAQRGLLQVASGLGISQEGYTQGPMNDLLLSMNDVIQQGKLSQAESFAAGGDFISKIMSPETEQYAAGLGYSSVSGIAGATTSLIDEINTSRQYIGDAEKGQVKKIQAANEKQAKLMNKLSDATAKLATTSMDYQVQMEGYLNTGVAAQAKRTLAANKLAMDITSAAVSTAFGGAPKVSESMMKLSDDQLRTIMLMSGVDPRTGKGLNKQQYQALIKNGIVPKINLPKLAKGGKIGPDGVAVVGEAGPELVSGPANVLSNASYEKLMVALDAMKEKKGIRFADNDFDWTVNMQDGGPGHIVGTTPNRVATLKDRTSGFDQFSPKQLMEEMAKRPEYADMQRAEDKMMEDMGDDPKTAAKEYAARMDQTNALLSELVGHMKQNVTQTSRVAMNTN